NARQHTIFFDQKLGVVLQIFRNTSQSRMITIVDIFFKSFGNEMFESFFGYVIGSFHFGFKFKSPARVSNPGRAKLIICYFFNSKYNFKSPFTSRTAFAAVANFSFTSSVKVTFTILSTPFLPMTAGTPKQMSDSPYSPSNINEQGIIFFWSQTMD